MCSPYEANLKHILILACLCLTTSACSDLFGALDKVEGILSKQRYIAGDRLTEADIRLFQTLIRFDVVYVVYFKCNRNFIHEFPHMSNYTKELYSMPGELFTSMAPTVVIVTWRLAEQPLSFASVGMISNIHHVQQAFEQYRVPLGMCL